MSDETPTDLRESTKRREQLDGEHQDWPRFIARPPKPTPPWPVDEDGRALKTPPVDQMKAHDQALWDWRHSWELVYEWTVKDQLDKGWECRGIAVGRLIQRDVSYEEERGHVEALADRFLANGGSFGEVLPLETRQAALAVVAARLCEVVNDGFLVEQLIRDREDGW